MIVLFHSDHDTEACKEPRGKNRCGPRTNKLWSVWWQWPWGPPLALWWLWCWVRLMLTLSNGFIKGSIVLWYHTMLVKPLFWFRVRVSLTLSPPAFFDIRLMWDQVKGENVTVTFIEIIQKTSWNVIFYTVVQWTVFSYCEGPSYSSALFVCSLHVLQSLSRLSLDTLVMSQSLTELPSCNGQGASPGCSPIFHSDSSVSSTGNGPQLPESYCISTTTLTIVMKLCNNNIFLFTICILMVCGHK